MLTQEKIQRYSSQIILPEIGAEGQKKICDAKVLIIGVGGLGSACSLYLAEIMYLIIKAYRLAYAIQQPISNSAFLFFYYLRQCKEYNSY